ncbi:histidinol-phosphate aminotransferase [Paenibacillus cellulosilyticus]|uniref:Histidinol-phosphate aminotransferase n=1 Tax=Paenibacillus cellulosilyticus TaxID=375489 RepID=A0A2V2YW21_9BACL|nr:histidinol-phosphate transaminase [Paenibacillus cellulosilyticus]PWW05453.1 histidinol-phosphate aminotransferase [Paenibacillus cellulosilyticus]QKS45507.1 histidinol-phosphate transaminase [Paenibacillus cellulosilyticus]
MSYALPHIERITPYPVTEAPLHRSIKLDQNESPYPPSNQVIQLLAATSEQIMRRYPDAAASTLRNTIAAHYGITSDRIVIGNGSSELITALFRTFVDRERSAVMPYPTFALYQVAAEAANAMIQFVPTREDFSVDIETLLHTNASVIALVNPNAPTGRLLSRDEIETIVQRAPGLVCIDEAYMDFAGEDYSAIPLTQKYDNLVVLRTFSKAYALSGARIGYAIGSPAIIQAFEKTKTIYNVSSISLALANQAMQDQPLIRNIVAAVCATRDRFVTALTDIGFHVVPSRTNFVLCTPPSAPGCPDAQQLVQLLAANGIAIRYFNVPRLQDKVRISIGTDEQMESLIDLLRNGYLGV